MAYGETQPMQNASLSAVPLLQSCWIWTDASPTEDASNVTGWQIRGDSGFISVASATNYVLETATNVNSGFWTPVTNGMPIIGVIVTNTSPASFFRLRRVSN